MPILIAGYLAENSAKYAELKARIPAVLQAMNFGNLSSDTAVFEDGPSMLAKITIDAEFETQSTVAKISSTDDHAVCGDFRIYNSLTESILQSGDITNENMLSETIEQKIVIDPFNALQKCNGDFACAVWSHADQSLHLFRDPMGIRPLFYQMLEPGVVAFASLPSGLQVLTEERGINEDALFDELFNSNARGLLMKNQVMVPPAGHFRFSKSGEIETKTTWKLTNEVKNETSLESAAKKLRDLIDGAVAKRLSRASKTASHISGGLDSSAVSLLAKAKLETRDQRLVGLTLKSDFDPTDKGQRSEHLDVVNIVQRQGGIDLITAPTSQAPEFNVPASLFSATTFPQYVSSGEGLLALSAVDRNCDVILSGLGGDQFASASGFSAIPEMLIKLQWVKLYRHLRALKRARNWQPWRVIAYHLGQRIMPPKDDVITVELLSFFEKPPQKKLHQRVAWTERALRQQDWSSNPLQQDLLFLAHIGAETGVRYCFPLLDLDVVEYAHSLPAEFFAQNGHSRALMRAATKGLLDDAIRLKAQKGVVETHPMSKIARSKDVYITYASSPEFTAICAKHSLRHDRIKQALDQIPDEQTAKTMDEKGETIPAVLAGAILVDMAHSMAQLDRDPPIA